MISGLLDVGWSSCSAPFPPSYLTVLSVLFISLSLSFFLFLFFFSAFPFFHSPRKIITNPDGHWLVLT